MVAYGAVPQASERDDPVRGELADNFRIAVIKEEEELVVPVVELGDDDGAADGAAKLILDEVIAGYDGRCIVVEPSVGYQVRIAVILVEVSMELVGTALG